MNERIKELSRQVPNWNMNGVFLGPYHKSLEQFAELIIRECAKVVDDKLDFEHAYGPDDWASGADVLNHFGIKP